MAQNPYTEFNINPMIANWMKLTNTSLGEIGKHWQQFNQDTKNRSFTGQNSTVTDSIDSLLKSWRMVSSTLSHPEAVGSHIEGLGELPSVFMKFAQSQLEGFTNIQQQMIDKIKESKTDASSLNFGILDKHFFSGWKKFYEQELSQFLHVPQLGLTRFHQERFNHLLDKYNLMQSTVGEFIAILFQPMERSFKELQDRFLELAEKNELSENSKDYYQMWIKILEKDYAVFFQSPEYLGVLSKTLKSMAEFKAKRDEIIQDMLVDLPIPSEREMDELYKEIYRLKKRVRDLEKAEARGAR
jgi:polyhydroxyalkanoate synthase subunit PhaE